MKELLCEIGLEEKEAAILLACLEQEKVTPTTLSKVTGIKRSTVYFYLNRLESKGLIHFQVIGKQRFLVAEKPEVCMQNLLRLKQMELTRAVENSETLINILSESKKRASHNINIEHYVGPQHMSAVFQKVLGMQEDMYWIGDLSLIFAYISQEQFYREFTLERMKSTTTTYAITDRRILQNKRFSEMIGNFRQFRFVANEIQFGGFLGIIGEYVFLASKKDPHPEMVMIKDENIRNITLFMFRQLWEVLPEK